MSDLSNLLGDVYGNTNPDGPPVRREAPAAERVGERSRAEAVFNSWEPAPHADAELSSAMSAALVEPRAAAPVAPVAAPKPVFAAPQHTMHAPVSGGPTPWNIGDDDIWPNGKTTKKSKKR